MLEKLSICLVHPKLMGKYIVEKTSKAVWLVVVFLLINAATIMLLKGFDSGISQEDEATIMTAVMHDRNLEFKDNKLTGNAKTYDFEGVVLSFFQENTDRQALVSIDFKNDSYSVYLLTLKLSEKSYDGLGIKDFNLSDGISQADRLALNKLVNLAVKDFMPALITYTGIVEIVDMLFTFLLLFLFLLLVGGAINPRVVGSYKVRLAFLSLVSYCVFNWFYLATGFRALYYLAVIIPYVYFFVAARNIVKIEG